MKYNLVITTSAYYDLEYAIGYYENKVNGLGKRMETDFWKSIEFVQKSPMIFGKRYKNYRLHMLKKFPYAIIYEILSNEIIIYRVAHLKMRPDKRYKD